MIHFTVFYGNAAEVSQVLVIVLFFSIIQQNFTFTSSVLSAVTEISDHVPTHLY